VIACAGFAGGAYELYKTRGVFNLMWRIVSIGLAVAAAGFIVLVPTRTLNKKQFTECVLSDTYPVLELYENYEIHNRRGDIWVLSNLEKKEE
jgi:hypothetical protein